MFAALATSGADFAWAAGRPDNVSSRDMVLQHMQDIVRATDLPVNADFENGFADDLEGLGENVCRAVQTGIAALLNATTVEQFDSTQHIDRTLQLALQELVDQEVGTGVMTTTLLKLVLIALLRRSMTSINLWVEQFSLLGDVYIARAFSHMAGIRRRDILSAAMLAPRVGADRLLWRGSPKSLACR